MVAAVGAVKHARPANAINRAWSPTADQHAMHVDGVIVEVLAVAQVLPMLTTVSRTDRAADLDRTIEEFGLAGAGVHHQHPLCRIGARRSGDFGKAHADRQTGPALTRIVTAVDLAI